jgi:hypothetical protein
MTQPEPRLDSIEESEHETTLVIKLKKPAAPRRFAELARAGLVVR